MDADAQLLEALPIMFTVIAFGLLVIMGVLGMPRFISALVFIVLAAFWAWGLIGVKRLNFWLQRMGRSDEMFPLMQIHLLEIVSCLMLLLILLCFVRPDRPNLQGMLRMVIESFRLLARPSLLPFVIGLAITGYGMGVFFSKAPAITFFFHGGGYFITIGLMVVIAGVWLHRGRAGRVAGVSLIVYTLVLLVATYTSGDW